MDLGTGAGTLISYYADSSFAAKGPDPLLFPRLSPDGTRLALRSKELWAVRRNMSLPPQFTQVGTQSVADSTTIVSINLKAGLQSTIQVTATDAESDEISYCAYFLKSGMSFDASTRTLTWTPPGPVGSTDYVRFEVFTPSGGSDAIIAILHTVPAVSPSALQRSRAADFRVLSPNPTTGVFAVATPFISGVIGELEIFDVTGRRIAIARSASGGILQWNGKEAGSGRAPPGVYAYRIVLGPISKSGRFVVAR